MWFTIPVRFLTLGNLPLWIPLVGIHPVAAVPMAKWRSSLWDLSRWLKMLRTHQLALRGSSRIVLGTDWDRIKLLILNTLQHKPEMQTQWLVWKKQSSFFKLLRKKDPALVQVEPCRLTWPFQRSMFKTHQKADCCSGLSIWNLL